MNSRILLPELRVLIAQREREMAFANFYVCPEIVRFQSRFKRGLISI